MCHKPLVWAIGHQQMPKVFIKELMSATATIVFYWCIYGNKFFHIHWYRIQTIGQGQTTNFKILLSSELTVSQQFYIYAHFRDQPRYAPNQWEMLLQYNNVSHWLGAYLDWSLTFPRKIQPCGKFQWNQNTIIWWLNVSIISCLR